MTTFGRHAPLRVIVVDDHPVYREVIVRALRTAGEIVVADDGDSTNALALIRRHRPDLALVDVTMPRFDGIDIVEALACHGPDVPVVLLSAFADEPLIRAGLEAGAAAYVTKDAGWRLIHRAVRAAAGLGRAPRELAGSIDDLVLRHSWIPRLTSTEHQLLTYAYAGLGKTEMCESTGYDEAQVRHCLCNAIDKLGADTLPGALEIAQRAGIVGVAERRPT